MSDNTQPLAPDSSAPSASQEDQSSFWRFVVDVLETLLLAALMYGAVNLLTARIRVDGYSMEPTLDNGQYVLVNKLAYRLGTPQRLDVVVFRFPRDPELEYIKRIIGLPGDNIEVSDGRVMVNGEPLVESYLYTAPDYEGRWRVPAQHVFVLGDNRGNSSDSHSWGPLPQKYLVGKAILVYWPLKSWGIIR